MAGLVPREAIPSPQAPDRGGKLHGKTCSNLKDRETQPVSCYVNGGILLILPSSTSEQRKQDVQHSLLFAQLAADKQYSRQDDLQNWHDYFKYVLQNLGWLITSHKFDSGVSKGYFVFASLALNLMTKNSWEETEVANFQKAFNALRGLSDSNRSVEILYGKTYDQTTHATSLILCSLKETQDGTTQLSFAMMGFRGTTEKAHRYLFHVYDSNDVSFSKTEASSMLLNEEIYKQIRASIAEKLGDKVQTSISEVDINTDPSHCEGVDDNDDDVIV